MGEFEICQDFKKLCAIDEYSFDLSDPGFLSYAESRGVLHKAGAGEYFSMVGDKSVTLEMFDAYLRKHDRPGRSWSFADDLMCRWDIFRAAKGSMQDCWEIYRALPRSVDKAVSSKKLVREGLF